MSTTLMDAAPETSTNTPGSSTTPRSPCWRLTGVLLGLLVCIGLLYGLRALYLDWGWFESDTLGQTLQVRRFYSMGPRYAARRPGGFFPRARGLLDETFHDNAWSITSADGHTIYRHPPTWWAVPLEHIPVQVRQVFIMAEDKRFAAHAGVDVSALLRATFKTLSGHLQGGSTIAMQVAKHCLLAYGDTPASSGLRGGVRKARNMLLALRLVRGEGRDKILAFYLNHAPMGPGIRGIGPAAWDYFRKKPQDLTVGEAALLATLLPSPGRSPRQPRYRAAYERRREALLERLYRTGKLDHAAYRQALRRPSLQAPGLRSDPVVQAPESVAAAFRAIDPVLQGFDRRYTPQQLRRQRPFPLHVRVSLHAGLGWRFYAALAPVLRQPELRYAVIILVDGRPVVLLGGHLDLFHYAWHARRQVGSVSKLFFYGAVWHLGYMQPHTVVPDGDMPEALRQRLGRSVYRPRNDDGRLRAPLTHAQSLSQSVNKIAYRTTWGERSEAQRRAITRLLIERFGLPWQHVPGQSLRQFSRRFSTDESVALGTWPATPFEVAAMLEQGFRGAALSRQSLILTWNGTPMRQTPAAATPGLSQPLFRALRQAVQVTAPQAVPVDPAWHLAAKTGTTDGGRDAWLAGFLLTAPQSRQQPLRPRITLVLWAGYDDNRAAGLYGGQVHGPVLGYFLRDARVPAALHSLLRQ